MSVLTDMTDLMDPTAVTVPGSVEASAGALAEELAELAVAEHLASLTSMPSLSSLHCLTSRHDTTMLPQM